MARVFQMKRGEVANLPALKAGEPAFTTDEKRLYVGTGSENICMATKAELDSSKEALDAAVDGKAPKSHASSATTYGVSSATQYGHAKASATTPKAPGEAAVGTETAAFARGDHIHPEQMVMKAVTTAGDGAAYTAAVEGITELTNGATFIMIPHTVSTSKTPTLNVNSLGAKTIRRRISNSTTSTTTGTSTSWLGASKPIRVQYDGTYWIADFTRPNATDIYGTVPVTSGGIGKTTVTAGSFLVGAGTSAMVEKTPAEVLSHIGAAPAGMVYEYRACADDEAIDAFIQEQIDDATFANRTKRNIVIYANGSESTLISGYMWFLETWKSSADYGTIAAHGYSGGHPGVLRRAWSAGALGIWRWENPPMTAGKEYPTTERWNGKTVYRKLLVVDMEAWGSTTAITAITVAHGISGFSGLVSITARKGEATLPFVGSNGGVASITYVDIGNIGIRSANYDWTAGTWYFDLKYTKTSTVSGSGSNDILT